VGQTLTHSGLQHRGPELQTQGYNYHTELQTQSYSTEVLSYRLSATAQRSWATDSELQHRGPELQTQSYNTEDSGLQHRLRSWATDSGLQPPHRATHPELKHRGPELQTQGYNYQRGPELKLSYL